MARGLQEGQFPVIWSQNLGYGYGMPVFEFYAPLPYYFGAFVYLAGFSLLNSVSALYIFATIGTAIGGYLLGKKLFGVLGGVLVSAAITLAPYRAVNLFVRGAVSEAWGILFLPLVLLGVIKTIRSEKYGWVVLVVSIAGLLLSHNLTALIFLPLSIVFGAGYLLWFGSQNLWKYSDYVCKVGKLAGFYFLAASLSAFYTIPALLEKDFTRLESAIVSEYFDYSLHFLYIRQFFTDSWAYGGSTYGPMDDISFYLGLGQLLGLFFVSYLFLRYVYTLWRKKRTDFFSVVVSKQDVMIFVLSSALFGISLLLTTEKTKFIWDRIDALAFLQFPWRYLSAAIIFLGLLLGLIPKLLSNYIFKIFYTVVLFLILLLNAQYFQPEEFISDSAAEKYYYSDKTRLRTEMSKTLPDYIPVQISADEIEPVALPGQLLYCDVLENCSFEHRTKIDKAHQKSIFLELSVPTEITFTTADFPGWAVYIDSVKQEHQQSDEGYISVIVPAGQHTVELVLKPTQARKYSSIYTVFSFAVFGYLFILERRSQKRK